MGNRNVVVGLGAAVVLGLVAFVAFGALVGVALLVLAGLAAVVVIQRTGGGTPSTRSTRGKSASSPLDLIGGTSAPTAAPLPTWTPPTGADAPAAAPEPEVEVEVESWDSSSWSDESWSEGSTWSSPAPTAFETNPLDELDRLDEVDVVAEVERLEARDTSLLDDLHEPVETADFDRFDRFEPTVVDEPGPRVEPAVVSPINEAVSTADEIMAASHATELGVTTGATDNSELQKLLAKVQQRLAAYE